MTRAASVSRLVAALAEDFAERIEMRLGALDDNGASAHLLRQETVKLLTRHIERVASAVVEGRPDDSMPAKPQAQPTKAH